MIDLQILHAELEDSLRSERQQLETSTKELHKQRELNEKLENDLLSINKENSTRTSGEMDQDVLANLDIGKKTVRRVSSVL